MRIVVHCGQPKTGTTTLQRSMWAARSALRERGVLYPDGAVKPVTTHKALAAYFLDPDHQPAHLTHQGTRRRSEEELKARANRAWTSLLREVDRTRPDVLVLSAECYSNVRTPEEAHRMHALLSPLSDDIRMVYYLRNPADRYQSSVRQAAKARGVFRGPRPMNSRPFLEVIEAEFGRPLHLRVYDRDLLVDGDIVADFLATCLDGRVPAAAVPVQRSNDSLSTEAAHLLLAYRRDIAPDTAGYNVARPAALRRILEVVDPQVPRPQKELLQPAVRSAILRRSVDLDWVHEHYGLELPGVAYPVDDGTPVPDLDGFTSIDEVCVVDPDRLEVLTSMTVEWLLDAAASHDALGSIGVRTRGIRPAARRLAAAVGLRSGTGEV